MITEDYCSFEVAKLLKEKGFDIPIDCKNWLCCMYDKNENVHWGIYDKNWYFRITHQMAMKWLREVHNIFIQISAVLQDQPFGLHYRPSIQDYHAYARHDNFIEYVTYEEAVEAALKYSLKNLI